MAADQSAATAQCNLASLEFREKDHRQAVVWFREAARREDAIAQEDLARIYHTGSGVEPDYFEAAKWVRLAADKDSPELSLTSFSFTSKERRAAGLCQRLHVIQGRGGRRTETCSRAAEKSVAYDDPEQISAPTEKAASMPRSSPVDEAAGSIGCRLATGRLTAPVYQQALQIVQILKSATRYAARKSKQSLDENAYPAEKFTFIDDW